MAGGIMSLLLWLRSSVAAARATVRVPNGPSSAFLALRRGRDHVLHSRAAHRARRLSASGANRSVTLVQAAHGGDIATVFRMLSAGADPNAAEPVTFEGRAEPGVLTPLEAAVESRQVELVQLLIKMGAHASDADRVRLACLARAVIAPEVEAYLQPSTPAASATDCGHIDLPPH